MRRSAPVGYLLEGHGLLSGGLGLQVRTISPRLVRTRWSISAVVSARLSAQNTILPIALRRLENGFQRADMEISKASRRSTSPSRAHPAHARARARSSLDRSRADWPDVLIQIRCGSKRKCARACLGTSNRLRVGYDWQVVGGSRA